MKLIERFSSLPTALATDEAMMKSIDGLASDSGGRLWFWEMSAPSVIMGRSSRHRDEINLARVQSLGLMLGRRSSGGATVVGGPGCLMYSVGLSLKHFPSLRQIDKAHDFVMDRMLETLKKQIPSVMRKGICDLTLDNKKFSGNALKYTRESLLYHGTILYDFDLDLLASVLDFAPRQPDYRGGRDHGGFVTNAKIDVARLPKELENSFELPVVNPSQIVDTTVVQELVEKRYSQDAWVHRH
ncbi:MAG: lipoate--protein ligase family protein [Planctomycetota bacterium]